MYVCIYIDIHGMLMLGTTVDEGIVQGEREIT